MEYIRKLNVHPYSANVWFTNSERLHMRQCRKVISPTYGAGYENDGTTKGVCAYDDNCLNIVIGLFSDSQVTMVHELGHAVINIFAGVGMPVNMDTSEAFCYLLDSLYQQCYRIHDDLRDLDE